MGAELERCVTDPVYQAAAVNLARFRSEGTLIQDGVPRFYAYRQRMGTHVQTGLVACASVAEYDAGTIKKHELTRADKEDDRTRYQNRGLIERKRWRLRRNQYKGQQDDRQHPKAADERGAGVVLLMAARAIEHPEATCQQLCRANNDA